MLQPLHIGASVHGLFELPVAFLLLRSDAAAPNLADCMCCLISFFFLLLPRAAGPLREMGAKRCKLAEFCVAFLGSKRECRPSPGCEGSDSSCIIEAGREQHGQAEPGMDELMDGP